MTFSQQVLFAFSVYLLVQLCSASRRKPAPVTIVAAPPSSVDPETILAVDDPNVFDIDAKVEKFVTEEARKMNTHVIWWDTKAEHSELHQGGGKYQKFKVTSSPGSLELGEVQKRYVKSMTMYTQWVHNDQSQPSEVLLKRNVKHQRSTTWTMQKSFKVKTGFEMKLAINAEALKVSFGATLDITQETKSGSSQTTTDTEEFAVEKKIKVAPNKSLVVRWIIKDHTQDMLWTADIDSKGWFAVRYANRGGEPTFYPVCKISHVSATSNCDTQNVDGGSVKFKASGTVSGVKNSEITLRIQEHKLKSFDQKPQNDTSFTLT